MNTNRLQLLRHSAVLPSYEALTRFLLTDYIKDALLAEPFVMFYQDGEEIRMVLAIGNPDAEYGCDIIDIKALEAKIEELGGLSEEVAKLAEAVEKVKDDLAQEIADRIEAVSDEALSREEADAVLAELCGFTKNEKSGEYEYVHSAKDEVIGDATTLAEAINMISEFVQNNNIVYTFEDSKSVSFSVEEDGKERKVKAEVVLSTSDRDEDSHDDNILVMYEDGLAATIDLHYDETKGALLFTRSCTATGKHKTTEIPLPFKSVEDLVNELDTKVDVLDNSLTSEIERAKAAEKRALIVDVKDGKGINLTRSIDDNGTTLEAEVNISGVNKNVISLKEDGLYVPEVQVSYDGVTNTMTFKCGDTVTSYQLAGVTAINDLRYDTESKNLIFTIKDEDGNLRDVNVYLGDLVPSITSGSNEDSPIKIIINKDTDKLGQYIATITAEVNNVWDEDIKTDLEWENKDEEGTIVSTEKFDNVRAVLNHILLKLSTVFDSIRKYNSLSINGIHPYDDEHCGTMVLKGTDIKVGGEGDHSNDLLSEAIEELYEHNNASSEVKIVDNEDNKYLSLNVTEDATDGHKIYTLNAKVISIDEASETNTGAADAKDVKDAIAEAVKGGAEVKEGNGIAVVVEEDATDGHKIYTPSIKIDEASEDFLSVDEDGLKIIGLDDKFEVIAAAFNDLNNKIINVEAEAKEAIEELVYTDSVSEDPEVVVKVSQSDGKISVEKRLLNGNYEGTDGKSNIVFEINDTEITASIELIDCGEY